MRGVFDREGKPFKCDVAGNDKEYGFNVPNDDSSELVVFEGAIDLMSYVDIFSDYETNKLALGMLADAPLTTFLKEHPQITSKSGATFRKWLQKVEYFLRNGSKKWSTCFSGFIKYPY